MRLASVQRVCVTAACVSLCRMVRPCLVMRRRAAAARRSGRGATSQQRRQLFQERRAQPSVASKGTPQADQQSGGGRCGYAAQGAQPVATFEAREACSRGRGKAAAAAATPRLQP